MKKLLMAVLVMFSGHAYAQTTATVTVASNYIWRGQSFSSLGLEAARGVPVVQGSFDYAHASGLAFSLFVGNSDTSNFDTGGTVERDTEFDPTVSYSFALTENLKLIAAVSNYLYVKNSSNNTTDYQLGLVWGNWRLDASYIPKYFGFETTDTYVRLTLRQPIDEKLGLVLWVGNTSLGDEVKVGFKNYMDYKAGLTYTAGLAVIEAAYTATNRKVFATDADINDKAATISIATTFQ